ncbi:hypothetical protein [Stieleria varia]|uniref:Uncharacterized protein n=1 Tax=Stieleria varia TaxID=2528005 RepID=A0A5C6B1C1_9BACT|nr:hypothetical protein [Stieleria varia]TWU06115.1 hypothetical protein Pla52n_18350 [Stieleria varia]
MRKFAFLFLLLPVFCTLTTLTGCGEPQNAVVEPAAEVTPEEVAQEEESTETTAE